MKYRLQVERWLPGTEGTEVVGVLEIDESEVANVISNEEAQEIDDRLRALGHLPIFGQWPEVL